METNRSRLSESLAPYLAGESTGVTKLSISVSNDLMDEVRRTADDGRTSVSATISAAIRKALNDDRSMTPEDHLRQLLPEREWFGVIGLARVRRQSVGEVLAEAVAPWLEAQGLLLLGEGDARQTLAAVRADQAEINRDYGWTDDVVEASIETAVQEVRAARRARRR